MATPSFLEEYRPTELPNSGVKKPSFIEEYRPPSGPMHRGRPVNRQATDIAFPKTWDL
jgi:hypothetical protein